MSQPLHGYLRAGADPQFTGNATGKSRLTYVLISHNVSVIRHMSDRER